MRRNCNNLPVYPADAPLLRSKNDIYDAVDRQQPTVLREMRLEGSVLGATSLRTTLAAVDSMFYEIADICGAKVPEHRWGLMQKPEPAEGGRLIKERRHTLIPRGYLLVAEVAVIGDISPLSPEQKVRIDEGIKAYHRNDPSVRWTDHGSHQFVRGSEPTFQNFSTTASPDVWLVDIEPFIG